jgi:hypothetical protein
VEQKKTRSSKENIRLGRPARKKCYAEAKATRKGQLQAELEAHKKKGLAESAKEHLGKMIDNIDLFDLASFAGIYVTYTQGMKHDAQVALVESLVDVALLKSKTEAGTIAVLAHLGLASLPNIANALDLATGGGGNVWEDAMKALSGAGEAVKSVFENFPYWTRP